MKRFFRIRRTRKRSSKFRGSGYRGFESRNLESSKTLWYKEHCIHQKIAVLNEEIMFEYVLNLDDLEKNP